MSAKKIIYIVSDIDKSLGFEWISPGLKENFDLSYILIGILNSQLEQFLKRNNIPVRSFRYQKKTDLIAIWFKIFLLLKKEKPDIIHTHLWIANLVGLSSGRFAGIKKRIYTRHHSMLHHVEHPSGLKWDRMSNRLATNIVAISENVQSILLDLENVPRNKVALIPHGFDFAYFQQVEPGRIQALYEKYNINPKAYPVIGVISRFTAWKGIQFIIPAFQKLLRQYPNANLVLANATGDYANQLEQLLEKLPQSSFTKIKFEDDLSALYRLFTIFVHTPIGPKVEAFGQTYVESLIVGIPSIFTLSGIAPEFIEHEKNALVVDFESETSLYESMIRMLKDQDLRLSLVRNGKVSVNEFSLARHISRLKNLYFQ
jgi:glycosyltransferase involved in cell wall biosynthesis